MTPTTVVNEDSPLSHCQESRNGIVLGREKITLAIIMATVEQNIFLYIWVEEGHEVTRVLTRSRGIHWHAKLTAGFHATGHYKENSFVVSDTVGMG